MLRAIDRRIPLENPTVLDYSEVNSDFVGSSIDLRQLRATLGKWGDLIDEAVDEEEGGDIYA